VTVAYALAPVEQLEPAGVDRVREIYEAAFPAHQRADFRSLLDGRWPGERAFALTQDGHPYGFALLRPLGPTGWMYLRYFAVDEALRGRGLGGAMWSQLTAWLSDSGYSLLVFDVDDPDDPGSGQQESQLRSRRIAFYRRQGAFILPVTGYSTPHEEAGGSEWTPMLLMAADLVAGESPAASASGVRAVVEAVYRHRWSIPPDHPRVTQTRLVRPG
jgi:GNAT superfamily N-acetyltransferase